MMTHAGNGCRHGQAIPPGRESDRLDSAAVQHNSRRNPRPLRHGHDGLHRRKGNRRPRRAPHGRQRLFQSTRQTHRARRRPQHHLCRTSCRHISGRAAPRRHELHFRIQHLPQRRIASRSHRQSRTQRAGSCHAPGTERLPSTSSPMPRAITASPARSKNTTRM